MGKTGVTVVSRKLKKRTLDIEISGLVTQKASSKLIERGIDLRLGLGLINFTLSRSFDVAMIFSQDSDLREAVDDAIRIAKFTQKRNIEIESVFPVDLTSTQYGLHRTNEITFDKAAYDTCIDPTNYFSA